MNKNKIDKISQIFRSYYIYFLLLICIIIFFKIWFLIEPFFYGAIVGYFLNFFVNFFNNYGIGKKISIYLIMFVIILMCSVVVFGTVPLLISCLTDFIKYFVKNIHEFKTNNLISRTIFRYFKMDDIINFISTQIEKINFSFFTSLFFSTMKSGGTSFARFISNVIFFFMTMFSILYQCQNNQEKIKSRLQSLVYAEIWPSLEKIHNDIGIFLINQVTIGIFNSICTMSIFVFFGIQGGLSISILTFLGSFLISFGVIIASFFTIFLAVLQGYNTVALLVLSIIFILLYIIENYVLIPQLICQCIDISMLFIFTAVIIFFKILGFLGVFFAIPGLIIAKQLFIIITQRLFPKNFKLAI